MSNNMGEGFRLVASPDMHPLYREYFATSVSAMNNNIDTTNVAWGSICIVAAGSAASSDTTAYMLNEDKQWVQL